MESAEIYDKNVNTFRFLRKEEELKKVDVSTFRQEDKFLCTPDGKTTYFSEAFEKWRERNYSISYEEFRKDIGEIQTLEELVFNKDAIVEIFLTHLNKEENLALPALLELVVALARDLQDELFPYFPQLFAAITSHLSTKDTELLENLFLCLAFLFKFFSKYIVKDIKNVYILFSSLLSDKNKEHIRKFACESFASLIRKVRAKEDLFTFMFFNLKQNPQLANGVGQLFFEVVRGVKEQFHYCFEQVFKQLLEFLGLEDLSHLVEESLLQMLTSMATHTAQNHCVAVQETFSDILVDLISEIQCSENKDDKIKHLTCILRLLYFWIQFKNGKLITPENKLTNVAVLLSDLKDLPTYCMTSIVELISSIMLNDCLKLPIDKVKTIISQMYSHSDECSILFTKKMLQYGMFEKDLLPAVLSVCLKMIKSDESAKKDNALEILSESISVLKPFTECEDDVKSFSKLYLHLNSESFSEENSKTSYSVLQNFLLETLQSDLESNHLNIQSALICLPHLRFLEKDRVCAVIQHLSLKLHNVLLCTNLTETEQSTKLFAVLYQAYFAYLVITSNGDRSENCFNTNFFMDLLKKFPDSVKILRMVDYYLNNLTKSPVIDDLPDMILNVIPNLASPFHLIRLFSLRILKTFDLQEPPQNRVPSVFDICFEAESIPLDVQSYREKLKWLRKLEYEFIKKNLPTSYEEHITKAAIYYIIGMLYVNFKLLWEPSIKILHSFANGVPQLFWDVFCPHLNKSFEMCVQYNSGKNIYEHSESQTGEKVDIFNHHTLLWKAMESFPEVAERKNKIVVPMLLQFMFKLVESPNSIQDVDDVPTKKKKSGTRKFQITKTLAAYLSVFAKFKNPKGGYKVDECQRLYKELLCHTDPKIQKLAFDCIMTFNYKYLTPYKENFYRILDEKTFKTEVVLFSIDTENKVIAEEHRMDSLAILMRILYGKMLSKAQHRSMILRFLAGCTSQELKIFFEFVFVPFKDYVNDDTVTAVKKIMKNTDPKSIVPIRKQHSALITLDLIFRHLGNLVPELLPSLLKILLVITATSTTLLLKRDEVLPHCLNLLKTVRTQAVMRLIQFFKTFEDYKFVPEELDAVFESFVWIMLPRLEIESVNQPSPLLRLLATWASNPRYYILFAKHHENDTSLTPLRHVMELYASTRSKARVVGVISQMVYQLLCTEDNKTVENDNYKKIPPIEINFYLPLPEIDVDNVPCALGTKLLYSYINKILCRFEMTVAKLAKRKVKKSLPARDLTILLRISKFVEDSQLCYKLIELLPPFLLKPKIDADSEVLILNTISSLLKKSKNPDYFIKLLAPLFGRLTNQNSRSALVGVFSTLAEIRPEMQKLADILSKINAYDHSLIGEPDYQSRLDGHKEALEIIKNVDETLNVDFIRIVIFNSSYTIRICEDLALRNSSTYVLEELSKILYINTNLPPTSTKALILDTLLPQIQMGIKNPSEAVRHEFLQVLSAILKFWKELPTLKELVNLCDDDKDLDFWENIRHLQFHRRARALQRFGNILKQQCENKEAISIHYLTSYMIPIVSSFLFNSAYKKQVHVIDAAIEALECIAFALPWHLYEPLLKQHLVMLSTDLENQKTIIKIIVSILNAFHFETTTKRHSSTEEIHVAKKHATESIGIIPMEPEEIQHVTSDEITKINEKASTNIIPRTTADDSFKIFISIKKNILPLLHRCLMRKSKSDDEHKLAGNYHPEDEDILRVPIALAVVKLLQQLPSEILEKNLSGLFLKMCDLLKTRTESIRETTRDTLVKMMESLGPKYFRCLLTEMNGVMRRGYQVHVMTFSINAILLKLACKMGPGDLDSCAVDLTQICMNELFSDVAEEKEVVKITKKLKEAKSVKSYSIFKILSEFISEKYLLEIMKPLKEELSRQRSHKNLKKISECLKNIALGLSKNQSIEDKRLFVFIHAVINESIPGLNKKRHEEIKKAVKYERPDIFLIPKDPGRSGPPAKVNKRTSEHVFIEFGLQLFQFYLKRESFDKNSKEILEMLDPFVALLSDCLSSNHIKVITLALQCVKPLYKYSLPSFKVMTKQIVNSLFLIVNKYAAVGMAQGENFDMIVICFKVLTALVKDTTYHTFTAEQLKSLLSYVEQDIYDYLRSATAFNLLKAILSKKLHAPELKGIMCKVAEMSITSEQEHVRSQSRQACLQYMLDYPLGKELEKSISFFVAQLEYQLEHGRVSALEMINSMLNSFPENVLKKYSALYLVPLSARLVNDVPGCRKMAAQCIKTLLTKVEHDGRSSLFSVPFNWLQAKKLSLKRLGAQLCGIFAEIEGEQFENHLHEILPVITELIITTKSVEVKGQADERSTDHFLYQVLNSLTKMLMSCPVFKKKEFTDNLNVLFGELQGLILYPHVWVRFATSQLFDLLLSSFAIEDVVKAINKKKKNNSLYLNSRQKLRDLSADFTTQLQSPFLNEKFGEQIVRNLIYLARVISNLTELKGKTGGEIVEVTLDWMIRKLCREAKKEVADNPTFYQRRKCVFMFMAAFAHVMDKETLMPLLNAMLIPLCREITDGSKTANEDLKKCAQEALDLIKTVVGVEDFSSSYAAVQTFLLRKKVKRKQEKATEAVTNPQRYAQKRIKKQLSKKESKKRKIMRLKGKKKVTKSTLSNIVMGS